jgi:osmotically inducible protein OsmC
MELLAAAHASCICGTVAYLLEKAGHPSSMLETSAEVEMEPREGIAAIRVSVRGSVPGLSAAQFAAVATHAKNSCPFSRALAGTQIVLEVELKQPDGS